jgi:hypothetical protein
MNSATLTKPGPGSFFLIAGLLTSIAAVVLLRGRPPAVLGLVIFSVAAAGLVGMAVLRLLAPLAGLGPEQGPTVHGRARAALERDKALTLRAIKELEFDRAMGKVAEPDFEEMRGLLRHRAMRLMRQLEGGDVYKTLIERDLATLAPGAPTAPNAPNAPNVPNAPNSPDTCLSCGTVNDHDARFCKHCGKAITGAQGASGAQGAWGAESGRT